VREVIERSAIGILGSGTGLALAETNQVLSVIASVFTIMFMGFSIVKIIKDIKKK
tara:strand:+ start:363 stop:527 length:165 start_codon:yes stop_codon:yes gene_type:complete